MNSMIARGIYMIHGCCSDAECLSHITESEAAGYGPAMIETRKGPVHKRDLRNNSRILRDDPALAEFLWPRLCTSLPTFLDGRQAIGLNERFRFYRYEPGQQFAGHTDGSFRRENGEESRLSVLIYLND